MGKSIKTTVSADGSQSYVRRKPAEHGYKGSYTSAGNTAMKTARRKGGKVAGKVFDAVTKAEKATKGWWPEDQ